MDCTLLINRLVLKADAMLFHLLARGRPCPCPCINECGHHSMLNTSSFIPHSHQDCLGAAAVGAGASTCATVHDLRIVSEDDMFKAAGTLKARATAVVAAGSSILRGTVPASNKVGADGARMLIETALGVCCAMVHAHLLACASMLYLLTLYAGACAATRGSTGLQAGGRACNSR